MSGEDKALERARSAWRFRGQQRPDMALDPGSGQESVWDYPRPPALIAEPRAVEVRQGSEPLARSSHAMRVCETGSPPTIYIPPSDVDMTHLCPSSTRSFCEWKGEAAYLRRANPATDRQDVAWYYPQPFAPFAAIAGWICFYPGRVDCFLNGERVRAQAGGFYGGWITDEILGPFKGAPGTEHW
ncbi:DUF427 domain-containing protein [Thiocystis violacea]|uniref:DUF427 domain-containing protein n=1 Tax=Thiocystis violacea TaxID=13725 RepID=UPI001906E019|nr:DUF427 domain-containing protein [Thiocystis violacea]MBK1724115.1 hypothetical protein [Thiocystis violacea]